MTDVTTLPDAGSGDLAAGYVYLWVPGSPATQFKVAISVLVSLGLSTASWKEPVRAATTSAHTLATDFENGDTIDGVVLATGDRILIKNQTDPAENGIYTVNASGAPSRSSDADTGSELVNAAVVVSEGTVNGDSVFTCTTNAPINVGTTGLTWSAISTSSGLLAANNLSDVLDPATALQNLGGVKQGTHTIPVPAGAMTARTTNGPSSGTTESTTNKVMTRTLDFDASTAEYAQISIPMPKSWNEGTVTVQFIWTAANTGDVVWAAQAQYQRDDDAIDGSWGTAQSVTDSVTAAGDRMISSFTSAITPAGTGGDECSLLIQCYRDAANGSDTCTVDAKLIGIRVKYTINAGDDS